MEVDILLHGSSLDSAACSSRRRASGAASATHCSSSASRRSWGSTTTRSGPRPTASSRGSSFLWSWAPSSSSSSRRGSAGGVPSCVSCPTDPARPPRWLLAVPILVFIAVLLGIDYGNLGDMGAAVISLAGPRHGAGRLQRGDHLPRPRPRRLPRRLQRGQGLALHLAPLRPPARREPHPRSGRGASPSASSSSPSSSGASSTPSAASAARSSSSWSSTRSGTSAPSPTWPARPLALRRPRRHRHRRSRSAAVAARADRGHPRDRRREEDPQAHGERAGARRS